MGTLLAAVRLLLLDALECGNPLGSSVVETMVASTIAREILFAVREVDRRVLLVDVDTDLGLITCVRSRIGQAARHSTPVSRGAGVLSSDVVDAEGRDREPVGEEATGGKRVKSTPDEDMVKRWRCF